MPDADHDSSPRLMWLNGPFGVGKTTVAELVSEQVGAPLFDPEQIGFLLRDVVPKEHLTGDFQDLELWRSTVVHVAAGLTRLASPWLVMPMTVYRERYLDELLAGLGAAGVDVLSVALMADPDELAARIEERDLPDDAKAWCRHHSGPALSALGAREDLVQVATTGRSPSDVVAAVLSTAGERGWF